MLAQPAKGKKQQALITQEEQRCKAMRTRPGSWLVRKLAPPLYVALGTAIQRSTLASHCRRVLSTKQALVAMHGNRKRD